MKDTVVTKRIASVFGIYSKLGLSLYKKRPFDAYKIIEGVCGKNKQLAKELWAAHECVLFIEALGEKELFEALSEIYLKTDFKNYSKNEITRRIMRFAYERHMDERTVYRRLYKIKKLWQAIRGI